MLSIGDTISFGLYCNEEGVPTPVEWYVFKVHDNQARIIVKNNGLFMHTFTTEFPWKDSDLRSWLNHEIYESIFSSEEKGCIIDTIIKDDQRYKIMCDDVSDGYIEDSKPVEIIPPIVSRDKLAIPQMKDISEIGYKNFDGKMLLVYKVKKDNEKLICELWDRRSDITVLDLFQCRKRDWYYDGRTYEDLGKFHGTVRWDIPYDSPDPTLCKGDIFGYRSWCDKPSINPMVWIDIAKYEALNN